LVTLQPDGGVQEGERFRVDAHLKLFTETLNSTARSRSGQWKDGICGCFGLGIFHPVLWNAWCCYTILLAQVLARLNMTLLAERSETASPVFKRMAIIFIAIFIVDAALSPPLLEMQLATDGQVVYSLSEAGSQSALQREVFFFCLGIPFSIYSVLLLTKVRAAVRQQDHIETGCLGRLEDVVCVCCCHCCTIAQLARQTANYEQEPAVCFSETGLRSHRDRSIKKDDMTVLLLSQKDKNACVMIV
jgi:Cys-rich protein (TIGR01571 family)